MNQPQIVIVLMEVGCHLYTGEKSVKPSENITDVIIFIYGLEYFIMKPEIWPAAALLPLPLGISANESANSPQRFEGF